MDKYEQLEKLAEPAIVLIIGAMLPYTMPSLLKWWFRSGLGLFPRLPAW